MTTCSCLYTTRRGCGIFSFWFEEEHHWSLAVAGPLKLKVYAPES